jgi:hypothetical protein
MSLIVDINPVPWDILELVKARILRNRAKKQRRQLENRKELRRVMRVDNGLLAKQRKDEPSFILSSNDTPFIAYQSIFSNIGFPNETCLIEFNGSLIDYIDTPAQAGSPENRLYIWSADAELQNELIKLLDVGYYGFKTPKIIEMAKNEPEYKNGDILECIFTISDIGRSVAYISVGTGFIGNDLTVTGKGGFGEIITYSPKNVQVKY